MHLVSSIYVTFQNMNWTSPWYLFNSSVYIGEKWNRLHCFFVLQELIKCITHRSCLYMFWFPMFKDIHREFGGVQDLKQVFGTHCDIFQKNCIGIISLFKNLRNLVLVAWKDFSCGGPLPVISLSWESVNWLWSFSFDRLWYFLWFLLHSVTKNYFENLVRALENGLSDVDCHGACNRATCSKNGGGSTSSKPRSGKGKVSARAGSVSRTNDLSHWSCDRCTFANVKSLTTCHICQTRRWQGPSPAPCWWNIPEL